MDKELPIAFILLIGAIIWLVVHFSPSIDALFNSPFN